MSTPAYFDAPTLPMIEKTEIIPVEPPTAPIPLKARTGAGTFLRDVLKQFRLPGMFSTVTLAVMFVLLAITNGSTNQCLWEYDSVSIATKPHTYEVTSVCQLVGYGPLLGLTLIIGVMLIGVTTLARCLGSFVKR